MYKSLKRDSENQCISWWNLDESKEILQSYFETRGIPFEQHRMTEVRKIERLESVFESPNFWSMIFWLCSKRRFVEPWVFRDHPMVNDLSSWLEILLKSSRRSNLILLRTYLASTSFLRWSAISRTSPTVAISGLAYGDSGLPFVTAGWPGLIEIISGRDDSKDFCCSACIFWSSPHPSPEAREVVMLDISLISIPAQQ